MTDIKPVAIAKSVPAAELNGLFGLEQYLIAHSGDTVVVVATLRVDEIMHRELADEQYPILKWSQIEPIRSEAAEATAMRLLRDAKANRKGAPELDIEQTPAVPGSTASPADEPGGDMARPEPQWSDDEKPVG
jgi:hypothetical protein